MTRSIAVLSLLLIPTLAWAGPLDDIASSSAFEAELYFYAFADSDPALWGRLSASASASLSDSVILNLGGYGVVSLPDPVQQGGPALPGSMDGKPRYAEITALNLAWLGPGVSVLAGKADLTLGVAELYSPTDRFEARDYSDPLHSKRVGRWQLRADVPLGDDTATVVLLPVEEANRLPSSTSPWVVSGDASIYTKWASVTAEYRDPGLSEAGVLVRYAAARDGYDFFVGGHYGPGAYSTVTLSGAGTAVKIWPDAVSAFGGAVATLSNWRVYGEALYQHTLDHGDEDFLRYTVGASVRLSEWAALLGLEDITPSLEFSDEEVTASSLASTVLLSSSIGRPYPNTLLGKVRIKIDGSWTVHLAATQNLVDHDYTRLVGVDWHLSDSTVVSARVGFLGGPAGSQFGYWGDNDFVTVGVSHKF